MDCQDRKVNQVFQARTDHQASTVTEMILSIIELTSFFFQGLPGTKGEAGFPGRDGGAGMPGLKGERGLNGMPGKFILVLISNYT